MSRNLSRATRARAGQSNPCLFARLVTDVLESMGESVIEKRMGVINESASTQKEAGSVIRDKEIAYFLKPAIDAWTHRSKRSRHKINNLVLVVNCKARIILCRLTKPCEKPGYLCRLVQNVNKSLCTYAPLRKVNKPRRGGPLCTVHVQQPRNIH